MTRPRRQGGRRGGTQLPQRSPQIRGAPARVGTGPTVTGARTVTEPPQNTARPPWRAPAGETGAAAARSSHSAAPNTRRPGRSRRPPHRQGRQKSHRAPPIIPQAPRDAPPPVGRASRRHAAPTALPPKTRRHGRRRLLHDRCGRQHSLRAPLKRPEPPVSCALRLGGRRGAEDEPATDVTADMTATRPRRSAVNNSRCGIWKPDNREDVHEEQRTRWKKEEGI